MPADSAHRPGSLHQAAASSGPARRHRTIHDVARLAGVSTATVNRVVQDRGYVAPQTRARVAQALAETGYRPSALARGLRAQRSFTLGHVLTDVSLNPFFVKVAKSFEDESLTHGFRTFLFDHNGSPVRERLGVDNFVERRVDALIFTDALARENVEAAVAAGVPVVQVERLTGVKTASVLVDNGVGAREAMRHLLALGHRRIAFIGGDPEGGAACDRSVERQRLDAYTEGLREAGAALDPSLIRLGPYYDENGSGAHGYRHMRDLLARPDRPSAVFATCDILAAGVLQALYETGLRVPEDMSVIGFDDTLAVNLTPPLTTVAQPVAELGSSAFRLALEAIEHPGAVRSITLETRLLLRRSTAPPARAPGSG